MTFVTGYLFRGPELPMDCNGARAVTLSRPRESQHRKCERSRLGARQRLTLLDRIQRKCHRSCPHSPSPGGSRATCPSARSTRAPTAATQLGIAWPAPRALYDADDRSPVGRVRLIRTRAVDRRLSREDCGRDGGSPSLAGRRARTSESGSGDAVPGRGVPRNARRGLPRTIAKHPLVRAAEDRSRARRRRVKLNEHP